jgi:hypothetical protein
LNLHGALTRIQGFHEGRYSSFGLREELGLRSWDWRDGSGTHVLGWDFGVWSKEGGLVYFWGWRVGTGDGCWLICDRVGLGFRAGRSEVGT